MQGLNCNHKQSGEYYNLQTKRPILSEVLEEDWSKLKSFDTLRECLIHGISSPSGICMISDERIISPFSGNEHKNGQTMRLQLQQSDQLFKFRSMLLLLLLLLLTYYKTVATQEILKTGKVYWKFPDIDMELNVTTRQSILCTKEQIFTRN